MRKLIIAALVMVHMVHTPWHAGAQSAKPQPWSVNPAPILRIGAENGSTDLFDVVRGATRLPNGDIMVGDRGTPALRRYSPTGKFIAGHGKSGEGPGEFVELDW